MIDKQPQIEEKDFASAPDSIHKYQGHFEFYCRYYMRQLMTIKSIHFNEAVPLLPLLFKLYWTSASPDQAVCLPAATGRYCWYRVDFLLREMDRKYFRPVLTFVIGITARFCCI